MASVTDTNGTAYASAAAVAGLAQEVEALRRATDPLRVLPGRVGQLAALLAHVTDELAAFTARSAPPVAPSWLMLPADEDIARRVLAELTAWMGAVYLRYADAAATLPECWLWHPDLVEELLWLSHAWTAAYQGPDASVALVGDWHDRYRPGVTRRIKTVAGTCSLENHDPTRSTTSTVPVEQATELIATWWATRRDEAAPEPTPEHHAAAARRRPGGRR